jgi:alkaline phosphatase D
MSLTFL